MNRLRAPIERELLRGADDVAIERVWRGVQQRRAGRARRAPIVRWAGALAVAAAVVALVVSLRGRSDRDAALRLSGGAEIAVLEAASESARDVALSDGSEIVLDPGARLEPLVNDAGAFVALLSRGRATFDVRAGGPRRWSVECGLMTVEVVGTRFTVERGAAFARVSVERGAVLVRGERVRDRVQRLQAGESIEVGERPAQPEPVPTLALAPALSLSPAPAASSAPAPSPSQIAPAPSPAPSAWRSLEQRGEHSEAYAALGSDGIARATRGASVDDLLSLADIARLSGHPADAIEPLTRVVSDHPDDARAPLAAFTLGRLQLDSLGDARHGADSFARAIALGLPRTLQEDAYARLVEARARAGDAAGARAAADEYEKRFPEGKRLAEVRKWVR